MPLYESVIVSRQDITKNQFEKLIDDFESLIKSLGGSVKKKEYWGLRNLAYEINKNKKGHYTMIIIDSNSDSVSEYERQLRLHEDIIRYMTMKIKEYDDNPSIMLKNSSEHQKETWFFHLELNKEITLTQLKITRQALRKPYQKKRKSCPFSSPEANPINYKDLKMLYKFVSERGKIIPSRISAVSASKQRELSKAIKRARYLAMMPYVVK